ncbi:hypothetical protein SIAM614_17564 [Stappia aggregata IAM 12614]|uniref:Uncharacterized protein n=1 Tax=Roseibium aggregatum (strain ATCC 25650 / DSM 13394 / JCM 20685 / NBRC 16684 / NCIMB 2208 / IAM 12614 / B1) TaxID=384765 RepID=A0P2H9_ROSAI|nr:hypothetical protein [Roseibium aggregatum]EAV40843.1 hypothetical protein SIAM614_17564 [Stappia aggregata IAM 12614] [Roseibium aggregatum IAM 12614]
MSSILHFPRTAAALPARTRGLSRLVAFLRRSLGNLLSRPSRRHPIPDDLLQDVLSDNGLRAREENRRRPIISGPCS